MKRILLLTLLALPLLAADPKASLPFTIEIDAALNIKGAPPLQGFASAHANGKWLFISGRMTGLHTFKRPTTAKPLNNFPVADLNDRAWVIDPATRQVWSAQIPEQFRPWLTMTNGQSDHTGDTLVITGGYGLWPNAPQTTPPRDNMRTLDTLTIVQVSRAIDAVVNGKDLTPFITQVHDARVRVTGGELRRIGNTYFLVFGQVFDGLYSPNNADLGTLFTQTYTEQIASFQLSPAGAISNYAVIQVPARSGNIPAADARPFHRRDLNVSPVILDDGTPGFAAWGGVFVPGQINAFRKPIYVQGDGSAYSVDEYQQFMSQYNCAVVPLYSEATKTMHTTFFGGISLYYLFAQTQELKRDDGLPFIRNITTLSRSGGKSSECIASEDLPGLYGSGAQFLPAGNIATTSNGVLRLDTIKERTLIGYIYGGIYSTQAQSNGRPDLVTSASNTAFPVYVSPKASPCAAFADASTKTD
ncbi:MAG TPA: hypothetical protein VGF48_24105 [Thermoanaerobaculia bacterium]